MDEWPLPEGWEWKHVEETLWMRSGNVDPRKHPDETFELYSMPAHDAGMVPGVLAGHEIGSSKKVVEPSDCLLSRLNPRIPRVWIVRPHQGRRQISSTDFVALVDRKRPSGESWFESAFLRYVLLSPGFRDQVRHGVQGATGSRQRLRREDIDAAVLPVPPLEEQRRIVARIEELFARIEEARRLRAAVNDDTEQLMVATLYEMFAFDDGLPAGWEWKTVEDVGDTKRGPVQTGPFGAQLKSSEFVDAGVPVLAIGNVQWGYLDISELKYVTHQKAEQLSRYRVQPGDILFTRMGTVGRSCVVPPEADHWLISYHLLRVAVDRNRCNPMYLSYCFRGAPQIEEQIAQRSRGATRAGVNTDILSSLRFPAAPLQEQRRVVEYLDSVQAQVASLKRAQEATMTELERLEQSILARTFRGEL